jgi:hypothetical protein
MVLTREPGLALALGRLAELQHLSFMMFWSLESLASSPVLHADVLIIDQDMWRELHADIASGVATKLRPLLGALPAVVTTDEAQPAIALSADDHVSAVMPRKAGASAILHAAVKALKSDANV